MRRILTVIMSLQAACLAAGCCASHLAVVTDLDPVSGIEAETDVTFTAPGQCEVQHQIKKAVHAFSTITMDCAEQPEPQECRQVARTAYRQHIDELLQINRELAFRGAPKAALQARAREVADSCVADMSCHHATAPPATAQAQ